MTDLMSHVTFLNNTDGLRSCHVMGYSNFSLVYASSLHLESSSPFFFYIYILKRKRKLFNQNLEITNFFNKGKTYVQLLRLSRLGSPIEFKHMSEIS